MIKMISLSLLMAFGTITPSSCRHFRGETPTLVIARCPALKNYSKQDLQKAAKELEKIGKGSEVFELINDYGQLREACRAIQNRLRK